MSFPPLPTCSDCANLVSGCDCYLCWKFGKRPACSKASQLRAAGLMCGTAYHPVPDQGVRCPEFRARPPPRSAPLQQREPETA